MEIILYFAVARSNLHGTSFIIDYFSAVGNRFFKIVLIGGINSEKV